MIDTGNKSSSSVTHTEQLTVSQAEKQSQTQKLVDTVTQESPLYRPGFPEKFQRRVSKNSIKQFPTISSKSEDNSIVNNVDTDISTIPVAGASSSTPVAGTSSSTPVAATSSSIPVAATSSSTPVAATSSSIPVAATSSSIPADVFTPVPLESADTSLPTTSKKKKKTKASPSTKNLDGSDWVLVNDGKTEFYFNKVTKAISFTLPDTTNDALETSIELESSMDMNASVEASLQPIETSTDEMQDTFQYEEQPNRLSNNRSTNWLLKRHNSARVLAVSDWEVHLDYESGHPFYYNTRTNESTWTIPENLNEEQQKKLGHSSAWDTLIERSHATSTLTINSTEEKDTCNWTVYFDPESQHHFYHNSLTQETTWNAPDSISLTALSKESNKKHHSDGIVRVTSFLNSKIGSWNAYMDDQKQIFYHHEKTNETSWYPPMLDNSPRNGSNSNRQKRLSFGDDDVVSLHSIDENMSNLGL